MEIFGDFDRWGWSARWGAGSALPIQNFFGGIIWLVKGRVLPLVDQIRKVILDGFSN